MADAHRSQDRSFPAAWRWGIGVFLSVLAITGLLVWRSERNQQDQSHEHVRLLATSHAMALQRQVDLALSAAYPLAELVRNSPDSPGDFEALAGRILQYYPGVARFVLAPGGVARLVVPLAGNEALIGHDVLNDPEHRKEASQARDSAKLTLAGPFRTPQGSLRASGRLPVFLPAADGTQVFWGFVAVVIQFPDVLSPTGIERLPETGHAFELWRLHPDTGERIVIAAAGGHLVSPIDLPIAVANATWTLSVAPQGGWQDSRRVALKATAALFLSLLMGLMARLVVRDRERRKLLERGMADAKKQIRRQDVQRRESDAFMTAIYDATPVGIMIVAPDGRVLRRNRASQAMLGPTFESRLGQTVGDADWNIVWPDRTPMPPAQLPSNRALREKAPVLGVEMGVVQDSEVRWFSVDAVPAPGSRQGVIVTYSDVTDRKNDAQVVERSRNELDRAQRVARVGSWSIELDGSDRIKWSPETYRIFGVPLGDALDLARFVDAIHPEDRGAVIDAWSKAVAGADYDIEHRIVVGQAVRWVREMAEFDRDPAGVARHAVGTVQDITALKLAEQRLKESEAHYRTLFADNSVVMLLVDPADGRIHDANRAASSYYGYPLDVLRGMRNAEINTLDPEELRQKMAKAKEADRMVCDLRHRLASGEVRDVHVSSGRIRIDHETYLLSTVLDMTEQRLAEARMREALVVFNTSSQGIMTTDAQGIITAINPAFSEITGYVADEVIGHRSAIFKSGRHDAGFYAAIWSALAATGRWQGEIWNRRKNGQLYPQWVTMTDVRDPQGAVVEYVALFSDITERKQQEEMIWRQANFDALTGLANRNLLADRLERALAQARRNEAKVGLAFLDLDGFKWINDTLGHDLGDQLLVEVAHRLKAAVREQDTVARLGGDEFTVVIHDLGSMQDMLVVGEKLVGVLREHFTLGGTMHQLSGSVGMTVFPDDGEDVQTLLKNADIAMYKAKQAGKNRYQFYARHMQVDAHARVQMEADLRAAIATGAFTLHYQPIVDADSGELVGAEALLRWSHPERGMVPPLEFIPVAEDCGLILPIGDWVLREAARQWQEWQAKGYPPLRLSVNVSSVQFREANLSARVDALLREFRVTPGCLVLEITESVLMDGSAETEARMREIKALGVGYALDDFGTGFSSLSYLKRFPVDVVKIDRSFVNDCPGDRNDAHLVEAIINMAHSLHLRVTAEGVETEAQLEFLRDLGCDYVQGYLIDRPLPAAAFEVLIQRRQLVLPQDGASVEQTRFLAALRQDNLDLDEWLMRLLGEHAPEMADFRQVGSAWIVRGLDLRHAIQVHLDWRRRLDEMIHGEAGDVAMSIDDARSSERCDLGRWIAPHRGRGEPFFERLDHVHKAFHHIAGRIIDDHHHGHRSLARRALAGAAFRTASRDVVAALIECYCAEARQSAVGS